MPQVTGTSPQNQTFQDIVNSYVEKVEGPDKSVPQPKEAPKPRKKVKAEQGMVLLSKLWDIKPSSMPCDDVNIKVYTDSDWDDSVRKYIPTPDPFFVVDPYVATVLTRAVVDGERSIATGETGAGKSHTYREIAARLHMPFFRQQGFEEMDFTMMLGSREVEKGTTRFEPAPLTIFCQQGGLICLDELYRAPASVNMLLQNLLEEDGYLMLPEGVPLNERMVVPVKSFRICATDNSEGLGDTTGSHITARRQDGAFLDRWTVAVQVNYPEATVEAERVQRRVPDADKAMIMDCIKFAQLTRDAKKEGTIDLALSPRGLVTIARQVERGYKLPAAIKHAYLDKLPEDQKQQAIALMGKVW